MFIKLIFKPADNQGRTDLTEANNVHLELQCKQSVKYSHFQNISQKILKIEQRNTSI